MKRHIVRRGRPSSGWLRLCLLGGFLAHLEVFAFSGASGHLIYELKGEVVDDFFGSALAAPGDLTGDGISDLVVGAWGCCLGWGPGRLYFFDGRNGEPIHQISAPTAHSNFARGLASAGDANGDGVGDVLVFTKDCLASGRCHEAGAPGSPGREGLSRDDDPGVAG